MSNHDLIEVKIGRFGKQVNAVGTIAAGTKILRGWGPRVPDRTRHSIQVAAGHHILIQNEIELINHSCEPNCGVLVDTAHERVDIVALRDIHAGAELFTDYATFEYEILHMPAKCLCGAKSCRGHVTGYKDLPPALVSAYGIYIAPYLKEEPVSHRKAS